MKIFLTVLCALVSLALILFIIFIFLISGRKSKKMPGFFRGFFAHRGLHSNATPEAPENSAEAFRRAVSHGFGIELDVHISRDGELFVMHDDDVSRMCGVGGKITELTSDEISRLRLLGGDEGVPRFSDVLSIVGGRVPMIVELKCEPRTDPAPLCEKVYDMLRSYDGDYCIESFNPNVVRWFRKNAPEVFRGQLSEAFFSHRKKGGKSADATVLFALENLLTNVMTRPDFVAYNCLHSSAPALVLWRRLLRMPTAYWTVREPEMIEKVYPRGCDAVIFEGFVPEKQGE